MEDKTFTVTITGAAGQIGYSLIPLVCSGKTFGEDISINLKLLDIEPMMKVLGGVAMEVEDCAYPLVKSVEYGHDANEMLKDADIAVFVGGFPRRKGMERKDLIDKNVSIFKSQGKALNDNAKPDCKVLVVANPANTNCLVLSENAPNIPKENFSAMTRLDHDRALGQIAKKSGVKVSDVANVIIWGNHSSTQYPDARFVTVDSSNLDYEGEAEFYKGEFITTIQKRGATVIEARGLSSAMSAANAASNHLRDWYLGSENMVSMSLLTDGRSYGIEKGLCFSFPVKCNGKFEHEIISTIEIDDFSQEMIDTTKAELLQEKELAEI